MGLTNSVTEALIRWQSILQSKAEYTEHRKSMRCIAKCSHGKTLCITHGGNSVLRKAPGIFKLFYNTACSLDKENEKLWHWVYFRGKGLRETSIFLKASPVRGSNCGYLCLKDQKWIFFSGCPFLNNSSTKSPVLTRNCSVILLIFRDKEVQKRHEL